MKFMQLSIYLMLCSSVFACSLIWPHRVVVLPLYYQNSYDLQSPWSVELALKGPLKKRQMFRFNLDSIHGYTWVTSVDCTISACQKAHPYNYNNSVTHRWIAHKESYIPGPQITAKKGTETITIAGTNEINTWERLSLIEIPEMHIYEATQIEDTEKSVYYDGSLSLLPQTQDTDNSLTGRLIKQKLISEQIVSFWTNPRLRRGEIIIGGKDDSLYIPNTMNYFTTTPFPESENEKPKTPPWSLWVSQIKVGHQQIKLPEKGAFLQIDTSSTNLTGDPYLVKQILQQVQGKTRPLTIPRQSGTNPYPEITFTLVLQPHPHRKPKHITYTFTPDQYFVEAGDTKKAAIQAYPPPPLYEDISILRLGSAFLEELYIVFDASTQIPKIGIAAINPEITIGKITSK